MKDQAAAVLLDACELRFAVADVQVRAGVHGRVRPLLLPAGARVDLVVLVGDDEVGVRGCLFDRGDVSVPGGVVVGLEHVDARADLCRLRAFE